MTNNDLLHPMEIDVVMGKLTAKPAPGKDPSAVSLGQRGGKRSAEVRNYPAEYYREIGRKGGKRTAEKRKNSTA